MTKWSDPLNLTSKPLAAPGLLSYRCNGSFGWIMIGAVDDEDAMVQARSSSPHVKREDLQKWDGGAYVSCPMPDARKVMEEPQGQSKREVKLAVFNCLRDHGWSSENGTALAIKPFQTVVGERNALVYLEGDSYNYVLKGDYRSEGRNQLEPHAVLIPTNADSAEIHRLTVMFAMQTDTVVAETYAARLHAAQREEFSAPRG